MFRFFCKSIYAPVRTSQLFKLYSTASTKPQNPISLQHGTQHSFTVQYLINQCGFSMEKAVLASSKYVNFDKPQQPDSVLSFLKKQGFTMSHVKKGLAIEPRILSCNPENTLLPKIQFFMSKGFSKKDIIIEFIPNTLRRSLENCIVPCFDFVKDFLGSEKDAIFVMSNCVRILIQFESHVKPAIQILVGVGMPQSAIGGLMKTRPSVFFSGQDKLKESVEQLQDMNMDPKNSCYGLGLWILTVTRRSTWDKRMEAFKKWGCSEEDVLMTFKINPLIMNVSEEKINPVMNFVREIGWEPSEVLNRYFMFTLSLKKTMIPRWSVYQELLSKGLLKNPDMSTMFQMKEDQFLKMFVNCNKNEAPSLLKLYKEKQK